ncbi:MAG: MCP four helix bundle domain-containing protein [Rubrivivax sp.]|nr:MCP four helix bundle domain-containing protein [Rubrivivax sp.]
MTALGFLKFSPQSGRIRPQLAWAFGLMMLLCGCVGALGQWGIVQVAHTADELHGKWMTGIGLLSAARSNLVEARDLEVKFSRTQDRSYQSEYEEKIGKARTALADALQRYQPLVAADSADERRQAEMLVRSTADYLKALDTVLRLGREKKQTDAQEISVGAAAIAYEDVQSALTALLDLHVAGGAAARDSAQQMRQRAQGVLLGLSVLVLLLAAGMALQIWRSLNRQLGAEPQDAAQELAAVADGDLTRRIPIAPGLEHSVMARIAQMQKHLAEAVGQVRAGAESVASSSQQIAQGNQELSSRTEQQASALQQTAATMEELGTTVRNNAEHAREASDLARGASEVAERGGQTVGAVVDTMKGINDSSRRIADIIGTIDGIAFQTNILALNAAVEAARAGEQGRGFAVVAAEVRNLAQRSANAAREIKQLINDSVDRVAAGSALVDQAGSTMRDIVSAIQRVSQAVGEISEASGEQSRGLTQASQAVTAMDQATQQNAALVEQSAAAAETLRVQAGDLLASVAAFRTSEQAQPA